MCDPLWELFVHLNNEKSSYKHLLCLSLGAWDATNFVHRATSVENVKITSFRVEQAFQQIRETPGSVQSVIGSMIRRLFPLKRKVAILNVFRKRLATKWLRILSIPPNDKIRNHLVANPIHKRKSEQKFCYIS